jgi:uncharacterized protein (DUF2249 family)
MLTTSIPNEKIFDVREIPCSIKHRQIVDRWINLSVGDYFVLKNDHDPVPLYYQFKAQFPDCFTWEHLRKDPEDFEVKILKIKEVGEIPQEAEFGSCGHHH